VHEYKLIVFTVFDENVNDSFVAPGEIVVEKKRTGPSPRLNMLNQQKHDDSVLDMIEEEE